jgi:hypothetical protein
MVLCFVTSLHRYRLLPVLDFPSSTFILARTDFCRPRCSCWLPEARDFLLGATQPEGSFSVFHFRTRRALLVFDFTTQLRLHTQEHWDLTWSSDFSCLMFSASLILV